MDDPSFTSDSTDGALLEWKLIGRISGQFIVPRFQRGYRWGIIEVNRLLDDIWGKRGSNHSLQPVVVKKIAELEWELIDGQQRLTTLYLILLYMKREGLKSVGPKYSIKYETRPDTDTYLPQPDPNRREENIDFFHIYLAYECISKWFYSIDADPQYVADKVYGAFIESVRVIWYEVPLTLDSSELFTRLNIGRIPLTDAELVKAYLFSQNIVEAGRTDRTHEIAAQWDIIERDLQNPNTWAFVTTASNEDYPTHISLLLDTLAKGPLGPARTLFHTFETLREQISKSAQNFWDQVVELHSLILGWYENRNLYHKIGYLVAEGDRFADLYELSIGKNKSNFEAALDERIRNLIDLTPSAVTALSYDTEAQKEKCARLLLLMNVETVRRIQHSSELYSFRTHRSEVWSLEHIHAQQTEGMIKVVQWQEWLRDHRNALADLTTIDKNRRDTLIDKINAYYDQITRPKFEELSKEVSDIFTIADSSQSVTVHSVHSISNLALLPCSQNSALGNSVFEVKRRKILELDRSGAFIPICTRQIFLKYYTDDGAQQNHFWSRKDREGYLDAMISPESDRGVIYCYLKSEAEEL